MAQTCSRKRLPHLLSKTEYVFRMMAICSDPTQYSSNLLCIIYLFRHGYIFTTVYSTLSHI